MIRIGTRIPVTCPMRVTPELAALLRRFAPLFVVTHFNHPRELTAEAARACETLVDAGVPVENQSVLLRRLNSSARAILDLNQRLLRLRVRPYYLHQGDVAEGIEHLRTPLAKGLEILEAMRGHTTGLAVPHLAVDLPGGGGKVTLQPDYVLSKNDREWTFRNFQGATYAYPEPEETRLQRPVRRRRFLFAGGGRRRVAGLGGEAADQRACVREVREVGPGGGLDVLRVDGDEVDLAGLAGLEAEAAAVAALPVKGGGGAVGGQDRGDQVDRGDVAGQVERDQVPGRGQAAVEELLAEALGRRRGRGWSAPAPRRRRPRPGRWPR